jgi:hypothetical protein
MLPPIAVRVWGVGGYLHPRLAQGVTENTIGGIFKGLESLLKKQTTLV